MSKRFLALFGIIMLVVSACTQLNPLTNQTLPIGDLEIIISGVAEAEVLVSNASETVYSGMISGSHKLEGLAAGDYTIDGMPSAGIIDPSAIITTVKGGQTSKVELIYATAGEPSGSVASLEVIAVVDDRGETLPSVTEDNINKLVDIYAAQTEEPVCITVSAKDSAGTAVKNAMLTISLADFFGSEDRVAIIRGCATGLATAATKDGIYTGQDGQATFTLFATDGTSVIADRDDVAKAVISAENNDGTAALTEEKFVFYNISHLFAGFDTDDISQAEPTNQRIGQAFGPITNLFNPRHGADNSFTVHSFLYQKQPQKVLDISQLGSIHYEILELLDKNGNELPSSSVNVIVDGVHLSIEPSAHIGLEDLPITAKIKATLKVKLDYGHQVYEFALKDFHVTKKWVGSFARIKKEVDHHVLTWAGPEHTLAAANAVAKDSVFTSTITLTATNEGHDDIYTLSLEDQLPAELGVIESSFQPAGGTYDEVTHTVSWNWDLIENVPGYSKLAPGESITASFQVYIRQKPGYCVDPEDLAASSYYRNQWTFSNPAKSQNDVPCYDDPYDIINGAEQNDVTVSWYTGAPVAQGGAQDVADFNGWVNKDHVIIWAVRPVFTIDKTLANNEDKALPLQIGENAHFNIELENTDRAIYASLASRYPEEFNGKDRDNPYARNVVVYDFFTVGLDFVNTPKLTVTDDDGVKAEQLIDAELYRKESTVLPFFKDLGVAWKPIPLMGGGDTANVTYLDLAVDLARDVKEINIALATASNMNQHDTGDCESPIPAQIAASFANVVADCEYVSTKAPTDPWLELSNKDNYSSDLKLIITDLVPEIAFDSTVRAEETYYYVYSIQNSGDATAEKTSFAMKLDSTSNAELSSGTMYVFDAGFNLVNTVTMSSSSDSASISYDHPAEYTAIMIIEAQANYVGNVTATATATWDAGINNTQYPLLPLGPVVEHTSIQPPF